MAWLMQRIPSKYISFTIYAYMLIAYGKVLSSGKYGLLKSLIEKGIIQGLRLANPALVTTGVPLH